MDGDRQLTIGFAYVRTKGSHAVYRHPDGRTVVIPQHGTIKRGTLASILRQAGLKPGEFHELLACAPTPRTGRSWLGTRSN
ncbi:MAG TPA: type II toxin-antitoxin system HicA family toxin [Pseudonocardiaceae bacterium]|nr:type II toxin-antitoxin system HicA family toxin [Pseudonocardiaceae bacterium]